MTDTAIRIENLSKCYQIRHESVNRASNLGEAVTSFLRKPIPPSDSEDFWALKAIDLEIKHGEVVGVIGRNGAGKSTLLKVLSRITEPTTGRIELFGRVGSLLEVGTGFHPELTGRENIFLNGAILGMLRSEISRQFDAIVDFAGVEKFLDTPVKRYSSGMYVRLAFAVAAHLNPEILIVDEVLAVGDAEFQKKCLGKMEDVAKSGRTVLFVSHNMAAIKSLCNKAVVLRDGSAAYSGGVEAGIERYLQLSASTPAIKTQRRQGSGEYRVVSVTTPDMKWTPASVKTIVVDYERLDTCHVDPFLVVEVCDEAENVVARLDSRLVNQRLTQASGALRFELRSPWLLPGDYHHKVYVDSGHGFVDVLDRAMPMSVCVELPYDYAGPIEAYQCAKVLSDFQADPCPNEIGVPRK